MTDSELESKVQEAEYLIESGHEDRKNGVMSKKDQVRHSQWVYTVFMRDCPMDVIRAVQEYEIFIISETE